jgi:hypothetical protein
MVSRMVAPPQDQHGLPDPGAHAREGSVIQSLLEPPSYRETGAPGNASARVGGKPASYLIDSIGQLASFVAAAVWS